ncbi:OadG family protein [Crassaminicella indica]|uniref:OadG family protein n=1 Tax=Crassaminicella indica TaxID=2855394 RepID=A0ABX8RDU1_9CLOT|nr:OadG family protein [Crassaminicella indica]QXM07253.1 OadG family protein [Crassaminicella indica]
MDKLSLLDKFKDPNLIHNLSDGDKMLASLQVMFLGMTVTFVALCILWGLIIVMSKMLNKTEKEEKKVVEDSAIKPELALEKEDDEEELVAVITAAIAASLQTSTHNIIVRNITRVSDSTPVWGRMGRMEQMNNNY